jgi:hypothetical protein
MKHIIEDLIKHGVLTPRGERKGRRYILAATSAKYRQIKKYEHTIHNS